MKHCFILNPAAGKGRAVAELQDKIHAACLAKQVDFEIYLTTAAGDASNYVRRTAACNATDTLRFYACGGDGTLCEVVNGVMSLEDTSRTSIGLIPSGTGNDFVRNFTYGENFFDIEAQLAAHEQPIDLIRCNDMYAINMVNVGFDCEVVCKTDDLKHSPLVPSRFAYIVGLLFTVIRKPGLKAKIAKDGSTPEDKHYLLTTYANGAFCGGGFHSNPQSSLNDGKIDTLFVNNISRIQFISLVGDYKKGTHLVPKFEKILKNEKHETVDLYFEKEANICVDGEIIKARELHLSVCRQGLRFAIPKGSCLIGDKTPEDASVAIGLSE